MAACPHGATPLLMIFLIELPPRIGFFGTLMLLRFELWPQSTPDLKNLFFHHRHRHGRSKNPITISVTIRRQTLHRLMIIILDTRFANLKPYNYNYYMQLISCITPLYLKKTIKFCWINKLSHDRIWLTRLNKNISAGSTQVFFSTFILLILRLKVRKYNINVN